MLSDDAQQMAHAGWKVFPVNADTKRPRTVHGHLDASSDPGTVKGWTELFDKGGAIATPTGNGLLVLDIDPRNGGEVPAWAPATRTVGTQSGGLHLHYAIEGQWTSRAGMFGPGVDVKCEGGYVLIPPSPGYVWENDRPRAMLSTEFLKRHVVETRGPGGTSTRIPPAQWRRGMIHDQVVAWAGYFAQQMDDERDVWDAIHQCIATAKNNGTPIDNAGGHIDAAVRWVLRREAQND